MSATQLVSASQSSRDCSVRHHAQGDAADHIQRQMRAHVHPAKANCADQARNNRPTVATQNG